MQLVPGSTEGDVGQSVRGNYKTRFRGGQNLTAVEGNASAYQVYPLSRTTSIYSMYIHQEDEVCEGSTKTVNAHET